MRLYVCSESETLTDDIDGIYFLITEKGEILATHWCSCKSYAKGDLYENRPDRKRTYAKCFGECQCLYLGEDDMTKEKLLAACATPDDSEKGEKPA